MTELNVHTLPQTIELYLKEQQWITPEDKVLTLEKPGEGNMNVVVRVQLEEGSLILKQSRPFVQKYPQIPAPIERVAIESQFYDLASDNDMLDTFLPGVIGYDDEHYIFALEDLGAGADYTFLYQKDESGALPEIEAAVKFLYALHQTRFSEKEMRSFPDNLALRKLNHEHLFVYPYLLDNGFDLDTVQEGLQAVAMAYKKDEALKKEIDQLGAIYLGSGSALLHGDYYPGSWLRVKNGFRVIDPEFTFFGPPEYDYGVMVAHFKMARLPETMVRTALEQYPSGSDFDAELARKITGMEILRRIIGLAQLPLELSLEERKALLAEAAQLVKS
ncbi:phosphotransferase [Flavilitoribacter nigricans]|uniref:Aminoglycoside phosphotransferase n=1 Tax=Flavilitoribacter nigricans (strain ATCC 23147 / DSM 23189 / NBRC 102662 / NCIMB 1420 / SS-2) TaxID=1122177 RepID=A0A2D0N931_FLAN2|nr:phosphotransferase [Flavilitoribacter nigricans]PHN04659.1 aminoglycoside phosphotransferase [Flavilitoribacter nigricans DSM 23189 = NBRC 102662]